MDPFEAATKETEYFSSDDATETLSTTSDASEPFRMAGLSLNNMSKAVTDDEGEEEDENMDVVFPNMSTATSGDDPDKLAKKTDIISQLTEDQMERFEFFRRSRFKKAAMRRLLIGVTGVETISEPMIIAVSAATKLFVGDIVETARTVMTERKDTGAIRPGHVREAYRRLKLEGKVPKRSVPRLFL